MQFVFIRLDHDFIIDICLNIKVLLFSHRPDRLHDILNYTGGLYT